tara:strand:+ start:793 stop:1719 length:927 start_codon:yes stop_codon:yes gene_type:complete
MNRLFFLCIIFIIGASCTLQRGSDSIFNETVNLESSNHKIEVDPSNEKDDTYGPNLAIEAEQTQNKISQRKPVIALDLVPALYASLGYITLFRELEKKKIYPNIINTSGFSLVIATLYAKYKSASKLEWKVFALLRQLKGLKVHTSDWYQKIEGFLKEEFKHTRIEQLKVLITVPSSSVKRHLTTTGQLVKVVMQSIKISSSNSFINRPHYEYAHKINALGVDLNFLISAFPDRFNFKIPNGFAWGLYTRVSGVFNGSGIEILKIRNEIEFVDTLPNLSDLLINTKSDVTFISDKVSQDVEDWINKNN